MKLVFVFVTKMCLVFLDDSAISSELISSEYLAFSIKTKRHKNFILLFEVM